MRCRHKKPWHPEAVLRAGTEVAQLTDDEVKSLAADIWELLALIVDEEDVIEVAQFKKEITDLRDERLMLQRLVLWFNERRRGQ